MMGIHSLINFLLQNLMILMSGMTCDMSRSMWHAQLVYHLHGRQEPDFENLGIIPRALQVGLKNRVSWNCPNRSDLMMYVRSSWNMPRIRKALYNWGHHTWWSSELLGFLWSLKWHFDSLLKSRRASSKVETYNETVIEAWPKGRHWGGGCVFFSNLGSSLFPTFTSFGKWLVSVLDVRNVFRVIKSARICFLHYVVVLLLESRACKNQQPCVTWHHCLSHFTNSNKRCKARLIKEEQNKWQTMKYRNKRRK